MLKILRKGAIENPWVFRIIMGTIAFAFIVTMGYFGLVSEPERYAAKVDGEKITLIEYDRAYRNTMRFYKEIFKEKFNDEMIKQLNLKQTVLNTLIERKVLIKIANEFRLSVTNDEIMEKITSTPSFQKDSKFNSEFYKRILAANRLTTDEFERSEKEEILIEKTRNLIKDSIALTETEINDAKKTMTETDDQQIESTLKNLLNQKRERGLMAFIEKVKERSEIEISKELI